MTAEGEDKVSSGQRRTETKPATELALWSLEDLTPPPSVRQPVRCASGRPDTQQ